MNHAMSSSHEDPSEPPTAIGTHCRDTQEDAQRAAVGLMMREREWHKVQWQSQAVGTTTSIASCPMAKCYSLHQSCVMIRLSLGQCNQKSSSSGSQDDCNLSSMQR